MKNNNNYNYNGLFLEMEYDELVFKLQKEKNKLEKMNLRLIGLKEKKKESLNTARNYLKKRDPSDIYDWNGFIAESHMSAYDDYTDEISILKEKIIEQEQLIAYLSNRLEKMGKYLNLSYKKISELRSKSRKQIRVKRKKNNI